MQLQDFLTCLHGHVLNPEQLKNIKGVIEISAKFHREAGIPVPEFHEIKPETVILESGHQPNFLPHSGTFKKPFLLDFFRKKLGDSLPLFGFADYNLSTASLLYMNRVPALTKAGSEKIGFKISGGDKWKSFNSIAKPSEQVFEKELEKIRHHYKDLEEIETIMRESYERAGNLADLNSFIFSRICNVVWNLNIIFFRYSDLQKEKIFLPEWGKISSNLPIYNRVYNRMVKERNLENIPLVEENSFPFWFHCSCGGKVPLSVSSKTCSGKCLSCQKNHEFSIDDLEKYFPDMSLQAVSRNLVFSEGLGSSLFISGAGGGLRYGLISNEISKELDFNLPLTLAWKSRDYYLGLTHRAAINELSRILEMTPDSLAGKEKLNTQIEMRKGEFLQGIKESGGDKKSLQRYQGQLINLGTQLGMSKAIFSFAPSLLDQFLSLGGERILDSWVKALEGLEIEKQEGIYLIQKDIIQDNNIREVYKNLEGCMKNV